MLIYTLVHIIEKAAKQKPNAIAFKFLEESITFLELDLKSNQLAAYLVNEGVQKEDRIGIYMPRCLETTIAVYGILKAGAVYVPLDPFAPINRTEFVINNCNIKHLITTTSQTRKLKKFNTIGKLKSIVGVQKEVGSLKCTAWKTIFSLNTEKIKPIHILGDDLAYILYTSGSTGEPKGIMHTHASALAFVKLVTNLYPMKNSIYGMHAPLHFDPSVQGFFGGPYALATTIIISDAHTKMPASLLELIEKEKISIWFSVPLALTQMLLQGNIENRDLSALQWVLFSGEVFTTKYLKNLMEIWHWTKFSNIYGPTETNQCTNYNLSTPPIGNENIPIGKAWGNTEIKILNAEDKEVKPGEQGELVVRTATMMKGYWNNPALTEKSLYVEKPLAGIKKVFYRTGDQVQENNKGELLFFGRKDHQVKLRGYRIELGEIENILLTNSAVKEAIAMVIFSSETDQKKLFATVITHENEVITAAELIKFCKEKLPVFAIPDQIILTEKFPRTASGKVNRNKIKELITAN